MDDCALFLPSLPAAVSLSPSESGGSEVGGTQTLDQAALSLTRHLILAELLYELKSPHV